MPMKMLAEETIPVGMHERLTFTRENRSPEVAFNICQESNSFIPVIPVIPDLVWLIYLAMTDLAFDWSAERRNYYLEPWSITTAI